MQVLGDTRPDMLISRNSLARLQAAGEEATASPDASKGSWGHEETYEPDAHSPAGATPIGHETPVPPIPQ